MILDDIIKEMERRITKEYDGKVKFYADSPFGSKEVIELPCVIYQVKDFVPLQIASGEIRITSRMELRVMLSGQDEKAKARRLTLSIAQLFNQKILAKGMLPAIYLGSEDDNFDYQAKKYESWVSEFELTFNIGEDDWNTWEFYKENMQWDTYLNREFLRATDVV